MAEKIVKIGCASGFWGDTAAAPRQLVRRAGIDYLVFDYLAEVTMSILARARARSDAGGYATDFVEVAMADVLPDCMAKGIRVVANAGGVNPLACRDALAALAKAQGLSPRIAVVRGDDVAPRHRELRAAGIAEMVTGAPMPERLTSANAYLGALPIAAALDAGADIVITGRCVDSAVALGPLIHEFGWAADNYDRLAAGSLAGHIIECGAQATGGIFTDWHEVPDWHDIGYPIVEVAADGSFVVSKPEGTGGLVNFGTVAEQMLYEIGDPAAYLLPDVACDFTEVTIEPAGPQRMRVRGARGRPPADTYKVSATFANGWRLAATLTMVGADAAAKGRKTAEAILARTRTMLAERGLGDYRETLVELLGAEDAFGPHAQARHSREVVMRLSASHAERAALELLAREVAPAVTSMAPGTAGYLGGRAQPAPILELFSFLLPKRDLEVVVDFEGRELRVAIPTGGGFVPAPPSQAPAEAPPQGASTVVPLRRLAYARSGDKGDSANIAVIARRREHLPALRAQLTAQAVAAWLGHLVRGPVTRYEVPGIGALNFVLERAHGGGGMASLRNDPQGKSFAQILLDMPVGAPAP